MFKKSLVALLTVAVSTASALATPQEQENESTIQATVEGGSIIFVDEEGNQQEIELDGAKSITIQSSNRVVNNNGEQNQEASTRAVIIGPDGEKTVVELDGDAAELDLPGIVGLKAKAFPALEQADAMIGNRLPSLFEYRHGEVGKHMIGVHCTPASETLRLHLGLGEGVGLVVNSVSADSPAQSAGVEAHDVLVFADDTELSTQQDLSKVVESAGEDERNLTLTLIRAGEEVSVDVETQERPANSATPGRFMQIEARAVPNVREFQWQRMGPGLIIDEDVEAHVERLRDGLRNENMERRFKGLQNHFDIDGETEKALQRMQDEMEKMRERLDQIQGKNR